MFGVAVFWSVENLVVLADRAAAGIWCSKAAAFLTECEAEDLTAGIGLTGALRWTGADGQLIYPAFQFALGEVHPAITRTTRVFVNNFVAAGYRPPLAL